MQGPVHDAVSAHHVSVALRIGRLSAVWRHLRGSEVHPGVVRAAEDANRVLGTRARALRLPGEFLRSYQGLADAVLAVPLGTRP
ncbi:MULTISPECIES: hypothetical protein [Streptomyces]|uniref:hypothetical protein n=1 Tax=Streptomyces TaxID=1883 RepID=UPI0036CD2FD1